MTNPGVLFVGSVPLPDAESVFTALAAAVGGSATRLPDGETGNRRNWIRWQEASFAENPAFELVEAGRKLPGYEDGLKRPLFDLRPGIDPATVRFGDLGYARVALESYATFRRLQEAGTIKAGTRFQVSLPTALDLACAFVVLGTCKVAEKALEAALRHEVEAICAAVPADKLAIQWDAALAIIGHDGGIRLHLQDVLAEGAAGIARQVGFVPRGVEVGVHLCYGDPGHKHVVEPKDLATCVAFANAICAASPRPVTWIHMPVPRGRDDAAYFAPLRDLKLPDGTELFLGLVHHTGGLEGTARRIAAAKTVAPEFGIGTECGFGRRDPATIPELLDLHARALALV